MICFIGSHFKGLTALAVPLIIILPDVIRNKKWKSHLSWSHFAAATIAFAIYLLPFLFANITADNYTENGLSMVFQENIQRFFKPFDHKNPPYVYLFYLPMLFLPWTPLMLFAIGNALKKYRELDYNTRWILEAIILIFVFFTASGSRRSYYILPIFPFCALLTAAFIDIFGSKKEKHVGIALQLSVILAIAILETTSLAIWPLIHKNIGFIAPHELKAATVLLGLMGLIPLVLIYASPRVISSLTGINALIAGIIFSTTILIGGFFCWQQNVLEIYRSKKPFVMGLKSQLRDIPLRSIGMTKNMADVAFYLDLPEPIRVLKDGAELRSFLKEGKGPKIIIARRKDQKKITPFLPEGQKKPWLVARSWPWIHNKSAQLMAWKIQTDRP